MCDCVLKQDFETSLYTFTLVTVGYLLLSHQTTVLQNIYQTVRFSSLLLNLTRGHSVVIMTNGRCSHTNMLKRAEQTIHKIHSVFAVIFPSAPFWLTELQDDLIFFDG